MNTRYKSKTAEWVRRAVLAVLLAVLLFALGRCIYRNRTVAEMNEYVTAFAYKGETYTYIEPACGYVQGTQIGKTQNGYRLFRVEGDDGERFLIARHPGPGADPICFAKQGAEIPDGGTVSSIVIGRTATADERIMHTVQTLVEAAPTEALACDEAGTDRMKLYFCFEAAPFPTVLRVRFGTSTSRRGITKATRSRARLRPSRTRASCLFWKNSEFPGLGHGLSEDRL